MNWTIPCAYNDAQKRSFHAVGRKRLEALATALRFAPGSFDIRSNAGGVAVSGEVTLHGQNLYVQVSQPATGADNVTFCPSVGSITSTPSRVAASASSIATEAGHETTHQRASRKASRQRTRTGQSQGYQG
jgi:hypothetical protein